MQGVFSDPKFTIPLRLRQARADQNMAPRLDDRTEEEAAPYILKEMANDNAA